MQEWRPVRRAIVGYLPFVGPIGGHHENFCSCRLDQILLKERLVLLQLFLGLWMVGSINNGFTIPGEKGATVIAFFRSEPFCAAAVAIHGVDVEISRSHGGENDLLAVRRDRSLRIVTRIFRQSYRSGTVDIRAEDVVRRINGPDVPLASIWRRWAVILCLMGGIIDEALCMREDKTASGAAAAVV